MKGLTTSSGGNISLKHNNKIYITPSGIPKETLTGSDIIVMNMSGDILDCPSEIKPSIESGFHVRILQTREDISAVVHAHPLYCSAIASSTLEINNRLIAESYAILGKIAYVHYKLMGSKELAESVKSASENSNCILMRNHGIISLGKNLAHALDMIEVAENAAKLTILHIGFIKSHTVELSASELLEIDTLLGNIK